MTATGSVWCVMAYTPCESARLVAVYSTEELAQKRKVRIEAASRKYDDVMRRAGYESAMKYPDYHGDDIMVHKHRVITPEQQAAMQRARKKSSKSKP